MKTVIMYIGAAAIGYLFALLLKKNSIPTDRAGKILGVVVTTLVFSMGLKIGSNEEIIGNLGRIGLYGLAFCYIPLIVTIVAVHIARKIMGFDDHGSRTKAAKVNDEPQTKVDKVPFVKTSSFRYLIAVILGFIAGYLFIIKFKVVDFDSFNGVLGTYITAALLVMIFLVGIDLAGGEGIGKSVKSIGPSIFIFPLIIGIATLATGLIIGLFVPLSFKETLAIICTFCWYSLAPNIIMNAGFVTAGAIAFLANFLRVLSSLILIPTVAKKIGWLETVGMPVAASMDVCIGTITEATDRDIAIYAFVSGTIFSILIPIIVPIIVA